MSLLHDANDFVCMLKKASIEAVEASKPTSVIYGKVISKSPLKIQVEQKMTLTTKQLVLTRNVTDYVVDMSMDWSAEPSLGAHSHSFSGTTKTAGEPRHSHSFSGTTNLTSLTHSHSVKGRKSVTIHNGLSVGEVVMLIRMQGGQKYIVMDRVVKR